MTDQLYTAYARKVIRYKWSVLVATLVFFALCVNGAQRVQIVDNYRIFFDDRNPHLQALDHLEETYAKEEVILFVLTPQNEDVVTRENLALVAEITEKAWQIPLCVRVDSITNFQHTRAEEDDIVVADLVENPETLTDEELAEVRRIVTTDPIVAGRIVSGKAHVTAVAVTLVLPGQGSGERAEPIAYARNIVAEIREKDPGLDIRLSGGAVLSHMFSEYTGRDLGTLTPIMYILVFTTIAIALRSTAATAISIIVILLSVGTTLGLAGWFGLNLTAPTSATPTIVMTLAVADCIHLMTLMMYEMRKGRSKQDAIVETFRVNLGPVSVTSVTTCAGLLTMNFSSVPPLRDFGNMTAMGVACAWLFSITLLPALASILPIRVKVNPERRTHFMDALANFVIGHQKRILILSLPIVILLTALVPQNEFRNNWVNWFDDSTQFRQDVSYITDNLTGINAFEFSIPSSGPGGICDPEYLKALDQFAVWVRQQPNVDHVDTLADVIKKLNMNMHGDDPEYYRIPETRNLAAQYLLLYEMSLPYGMDLNNRINIDKSATRIQVISKDNDSTIINDLKYEFENWFVTNAPTYMRTQATGNGVMFASIASTTITNMLISTPIALLFISFTLILVFRSLRFGLISILPNLVPILCALGLWGLLVGRINFGVACVAGMSIGIIVDDTVHFLSKYIRGRRDHNYTPEESVRYAFNTVGRAMIITSGTLILGFSVMTLSVFKFNANMGLLTITAIIFAIIADIFVLPAFLIRFDRTHAGKKL